MLNISLIPKISLRSGSKTRADSMFSPMIPWTGTAAENAVRIWVETWSSSTAVRNRYRYII